MHFRDPLLIISSHLFHDKNLPSLFAHSGGSSRSTEGPADLDLRSSLNPMIPYTIRTFLLTEKTGYFSVSRTTSFEIL